MLTRRQLLLAATLQPCASVLARAPPDVGTMPDPGASEPVVYLTVDDGWTAQDAILDSFIKHRVKGTFYVTGEALLAYAPIWQRAREAGMEFGCHGSAHLRASGTTRDQFVADLVTYCRSARQVLGADWRTLVASYRFPYGDTGGHRHRDAYESLLLREFGWCHVEWDLDLSFSEKPGRPAYTELSAPLALYTKHRPANAVVLTHFAHNDARVLEHILATNPGGARFAGISEWLAKHACAVPPPASELVHTG